MYSCVQIARVNHGNLIAQQKKAATTYVTLQMALREHLDGRQQRRDVVDGSPLVLDDVHADGTISVHVRMENFACEADTWRFIGVLVAEDYSQGKRPTWTGHFSRQGRKISNRN
eukprot:scaffold296488_cov26-Prasinocladus_malaysianus.AAC.1